MLYTLYRISDKGNKKNKLKHADKLYCIKNYINVFGKENLVVFADNCYDETIANLNSLGLQIIELAGLGNALSFMAILDYAINKFSDDDHVYFLEDDYLHLNNAKQVLLEGFEIADYVTLYDSPDKYIDYKKGGYNHYVSGNGEECKVFITQTSHWKITNSTTMTFACQVKTLKEDYKVWSFYKTQDYLAFQKLAGYPLKFSSDLQVLKNKLSEVTSTNLKSYKKRLTIICHYYKNKFHTPKRTLIVPIPGKATHVEVEYLTPLTDWNLV
ncbi:MAG: hypothetical protein JWQ63_1421 [Mucilaginibacter sp.]|nr:hypothetical protein [Mucilaginibacter sp.]